MDGFETSEVLLHKLKMKKQPTIIAVSSMCTQADRERCQKIGILDYLSKPLRLDELQLSMQSLGYLLDISPQEGARKNIAAA